MQFVILQIIAQLMIAKKVSHRIWLLWYGGWIRFSSTLDFLADFLFEIYAQMTKFGWIFIYYTFTAENKL